MSDPVTNVEIEDVLSSIRRLVSTDTRLPPKLSSDRLLLTPAQRVRDDSAATDKATAGPKYTGEPQPTGEARAPRTGGSGDAAPGVFVLSASARSDRGAESRTTGAPKPDTRAAGQPGGSAVQNRSHATTGPTADPDVFDFIAPGNRTKKATPPDGGTLPKGRPVNGPTTPGDDTNDVAADPAPGPRTSSLESKIAELEAMVSHGGAAWDPTTEDEAEPDAVAAKRPATSIRPAPSGPASSARDHAISGEIHTDGNGSLVPADGTVLDEAILREIVSEIVRDELQGVLGERITRNVRNLVRREINRALLSQDFD